MTGLLDEVLEAHGGLGRWRAARTITARVHSGGLLIRTRVPGNRFADYRVTVEDPAVFTRPWTMAFPAFERYPAGTELYEYACAEGNAIDETVFGVTTKKEPK